MINSKFEINRKKIIVKQKIAYKNTSFTRSKNSPVGKNQ